MMQQKLTALPRPFLMALSRDLTAMQRFSALSEEEQLRIAQQAQTILTREEMERFVGSI